MNSYPKKLNLRLELIFISALICILLLTSPSIGQAQALRAGVIGATKSIYGAELRGIKSRIRVRNTPVKQNYFKGNSIQHQSSSTSRSSNTSNVRSFDGRLKNEPVTQTISKDQLTSSESELNSNGWQSF